MREERGAVQPHAGIFLSEERKDVLPPATAWTDPEAAVRRDRSQTQKDTSRVTPRTGGSPEESRPPSQRVDGGSQGWGGRASWGQGLSLGRWKVLETDGGGGCTTVSALDAPELCT